MYTRKGPGDIWQPPEYEGWDDGDRGESAGTLQFSVPFETYKSMSGINVSSLKELRRSPLHYRHRLTHPATSDALTLGTAAHIATLEPARYAQAVSVWDRKTDTGRAAPRNGKAWDAFVADAGERTIITADDDETARAIAEAVRNNPVAARYLAVGAPEVSMRWQRDGRMLKGRVDWLTVQDGVDVIVGLKTTRDCRPREFGVQAHRLGYHLQWAYYRDGFAAITGRIPQMVEIVVESAAPHAVAVYTIPEPVLNLGREEYEEALTLLRHCEQSGQWPGPVEHETELALPMWAYGVADEITIADAEN